METFCNVVNRLLLINGHGQNGYQNGVDLVLDYLFFMLPSAYWFARRASNIAHTGFSLALGGNCQSYSLAKNSCPSSRRPLPTNNLQQLLAQGFLFRKRVKHCPRLSPSNFYKAPITFALTYLKFSKNKTSP